MRTALAAAALMLLLAAPAAAAEPTLQTPRAKLAAALHCQRAVTRSKAEPVLLVTGTGVDGSRTWPRVTQPALTAARHPSCFLDFPQHTTGDMQVAAEYVTYGIRTVARRAGRGIAIYGLSQGGVLPRMALTYWPSTQRLVTDAVLLAGTQHGTGAGPCVLPCAAALWQQARGSKLLRALNAGDETPGAVAYTTVRTLTDGVVVPAGGPHPTSALRGASNVLVQAVCPGRVIDHFGLAVDTVAFTALLDAIAHRGPARAARFPSGTCARPFASDQPEQAIRDGIVAMTREAVTNIVAAPVIAREPRVRLRRR
jgi:triacylglycerol lipase